MDPQKFEAGNLAKREIISSAEVCTEEAVSQINDALNLVKEGIMIQADSLYTPYIGCASQIKTCQLNNDLNELQLYLKMALHPLQKAMEVIQNQKNMDIPIKEMCISLIEAMIVKGNNKNWDDIIGLQDIKDVLYEIVILPQFLIKQKIDSHKGILITGPPGTGKTHIVGAAAKKAGCTLFSAQGANFFEKKDLDPGFLMRELFAAAKKASPAIIVFDEADGIFGDRSSIEATDAENRLKNCFLNEMDLLNKADCVLLVVLITNFPWLCDAAVLRRMERFLYADLPNEIERAEFLSTMLKSQRTSGGLDVEKIANYIPGRSIADMRFLFRSIKSNALTREAKQFTAEELETHVNVEFTIMDEDVLKAIKECPVSVSRENIAQFENWFHKQKAN